MSGVKGLRRSRLARLGPLRLRSRSSLGLRPRRAIFTRVRPGIVRTCMYSA